MMQTDCGRHWTSCLLGKACAEGAACLQIMESSYFWGLITCHERQRCIIVEPCLVLFLLGAGPDLVN